ncbi:SIR2 family protein [Anaerotignum propionicum]|uniref:NAD(+) hydrolase ThsA n=1 Tax=Anaerotignum propionicum DSM 1682 TaxID=991789 RepID=A0A0X1U7K1_ANAPI|nr:SIR2 family protein [Anaerotignum propionicum]AMJ40926.1 hypothetical protein CPRO_13330 [Anaerotignum propionicum DSM 1682]SHE59033.1 SIR2-like domain-containing protein [[Clostridium] propionicum DSM 1682] [Anaerotignum propionicum DSM 1682]
MSKKEIDSFINKFVKEMKDDNVAIFAGAGFSKSGGFVDWKNLLKGVADELDLDIIKEYDLVTLAQYYVNRNGNRSTLNDIIFEEFTKDAEISENHKILARLPISTFWTTNYDSLLEDALKETHRVVDVKYTNKHLSITMPRRDAVVYKMHGDKSHPDDVILIKDDYENYYRKHSQYITTLSGMLISKTFLFVGFSFTDPNIDYILSRVKIDYSQENQRQHYSIMRKISANDFTDNAEFEYVKRKQTFFVEDLKRYNIKTILVDEYDDITKILSTIEKKLIVNNIFISGSAHEYGDFEEKEAKEFISKLSNSLIKSDFNVVSGFGVGIGSAVISGALEEIYMKGGTIKEDRLLLRPFPQGEDYKLLWQAYREDMISRAGVSIFLFGNKLVDGEIKLADGIQNEFLIAKNKGHSLLPLGYTGYKALELWNEINDNFEKYYPNDDKLKTVFQQFNLKKSTLENIQDVLHFIKLLKEKM